jgi:hypothetical protein
MQAVESKAPKLIKIVMSQELEAFLRSRDKV